MTYSAEQLKDMCPAKILECSQKHVQSVIEELIETALAQPASTKERWNIERDGDALLVCFNGHEKGEACSYERFVPEAQPASVPAGWHGPLIHVRSALSMCFRWAPAERGSRLQAALNEIDAMLAASPQAPQPEAQPSIQDLAAGMAVMKEAAKRQLNLNDPSVRKRLAAQWGYVQAHATAHAEALADAYGELQALRNHVEHWRRSGLDDAAIRRADDALADRRIQAPAVGAETPRRLIDDSDFGWTG